MMLADSANAILLWQIVEIVAVVSGVFCPIIMLVFMRSDKKQRREVSFEFEPVSKTDFEKHKEWNRHEHENIHSKIGGVERGAQAKLEAAIGSGNNSREQLHRRMNSFGESMGELRGKIEILIKKLS